MEVGRCLTSLDHFGGWVLRLFFVRKRRRDGDDEEVERTEFGEARAS